MALSKLARNLLVGGTVATVLLIAASYGMWQISAIAGYIVWLVAFACTAVIYAGLIVWIYTKRHPGASGSEARVAAAVRIILVGGFTFPTYMAVLFTIVGVLVAWLGQDVVLSAFDRNTPFDIYKFIELILFLIAGTSFFSMIFLPPAGLIMLMRAKK